MRISFLNWRPDADDFGNDGLTVADNVVHDSEGWKLVRLRSANAFSTTIAASVTSVIAKPVGSQNDRLVAWVENFQNIHIGVNGVTGTSPTTGYPISFSTTGSVAITAFDVAEIEGNAYFTVRVEQSQLSPSSETVISFSGYLPV